MIESEIVAVGSVKGVLSGKHYNRCIHTHLAIFEAMERLRLDSFEKSLTTAEKAVLHSINSAYSTNSDKFTEISVGNDVASIKMLYDKFIETRCEESPLFAFWSNYIEMVQILRLFIRATRTSNWDLHLSSLRSMIPWFFSCDRVNYARYSSCYWLEMMCLDKTHPCKFFVWINHIHRGVTRTLIGGECIFIYSCCARRISFEICCF